MPEPVYNLFTEDACGNPVWLDAVADFEVACTRLTQWRPSIPANTLSLIYARDRLSRV
jgi:hypothetical protein